MRINIVLVMGVIALCIPPLAGATEKTRFQNWVADKGPSYQEAYTWNDAGDGLGVLCSITSQSCFAYFRTRNQCQDGQAVPVLVNADTGASVFTTKCRPLHGESGNEYVNVFDDFNVVSVMLRAQDIGIAIPLDKGLFRSTRFSLMGSNEAIASARLLPANIPPKPKDSETF